ncbi:MAG: oxygenase MpaB family protein [Polyangiales bacterium]
MDTPHEPRRGVAAPSETPTSRAAGLVLTDPARAALLASRPLPGRVRPFAKTQERSLRMRVVFGRDPAPTEPEWRAMADALWDGDAPADAMVQAMFELGPRAARALFERAVEGGIARVPEAPPAMKAFFELVERDPAWLERPLLDEARRFIHGAGLAGPYVLRDFALMGGYRLSGFNHALILTGALNKGAAQRVAETGQWWIDCTETNGFERTGAGYKSTLRVRLVHALVRRGLANKAEWDLARWGLPVSQIDMVATYLAFGPVMLAGLRMMGVPITARESKAVMHLWKYAGWLMGVEDRWLVDTERQGLLTLYHTFMTQSLPDWTSRELALALANEPLERKYESLPRLRGRFEYYRHLSVTRYFLGKEKMEGLGLPTSIPPWYPLLSAGPRFVRYTSQRFVPGLRERQERDGRAEQLATLATMFGDREHGIIRPDAGHPAGV